MTIEEILSGDALSQLDSEVLLAHVMHRNRTWILAHPEAKLSAPEQTKFIEFLERRRRGEPLAYITEIKEFFGRPFFVNKDVLIPRPSTEGLIETVIRFLKEQEDSLKEVDTDIMIVSKKFDDLSGVSTIVDVGTGSGCIAVTLALELPAHRFIATDISSDSLSIAKENAEKHGVADRIQFEEGEGLFPLHGFTEPFLLVSNPPYIPNDEKLMCDVAHFEPAEALYGGEKGTDILEELIEEATDHPFCKGMVLECRKEQISSLLE